MSHPLTGPRVALFGKAPRHGDFIRRNLGPEAEIWDAWLSREMERARERWGDGFPAAHDVAAPWLFITRLGDPDGWSAGALCPSVDQPGRRFFLVLMGAGLPPTTPLCAVAEAMETRIYRAFELDLEADDILEEGRAALAGVLETAIGAPEAARETWWRAGDPLRLHQAPADLLSPMTSSDSLGEPA